MNRTRSSHLLRVDPVSGQPCGFERCQRARPSLAGKKAPWKRGRGVLQPSEVLRVDPAGSAVAVGPRGHTPRAPSAELSHEAVAPSR